MKYSPYAMSNKTLHHTITIFFSMLTETIIQVYNVIKSLIRHQITNTQEWSFYPHHLGTNPSSLGDILANTIMKNPLLYN